MPDLTEHPAHALLLDLLRRQIGLDPTSACADKVPSALAALGLNDANKLTAYVASVQHQPHLLHELIRQIVVHETWFFREPAAFDVLVRAGLEAAAEGRRFKVLSAPCSTGEEPYSIAIALIEAGVPRELIDIVAVDISEDAVQQARQGLFTAMAFRGSTPEWRDARFVREGQRWRLKTRLDDVIRFEAANLMALPAHLSLERFDAVFCRNLLIYLDAQARRELCATLRALAQADTGLIFVGHAESTDAFHGELARVVWPMSFAFYNRAHGRAHRDRADSNQTHGLLRAASAQAASRTDIPTRLRGMNTDPRPTATGALPGTPAPVAIKRQSDPLHEVRLLADRGEIDRAVTLCERTILSHPESADVRCYRGVLAVAAGQTQVARDAFAKALYLDPRHADSLHHLMLLAQGEGDAAGMQRYRERLQRLQSTSAASSSGSSNSSSSYGSSEGSTGHASASVAGRSREVRS